MKILIMYFSGTGSTAKVANDIGKSIQNIKDDQENQHIIEFLPIKRAFLSQKNTTIDFSTFDLIGIGTPTYSFRAPRLVTKILKSLKIKSMPYFLFLSCGGMEGLTFLKIYKILNKKKCTLIGTHAAYGSNNLRSWRSKLSKPVPISDGLHLNEKARISNFAQLIIKNYNSIIKGNVEPLNVRGNIPWSIYCGLFTYGWQMRFILGKKYVIEEKCTKCGICAENICPSECISIGNNGYPQFKEFNCIGCQGCVSLCPTLAIESRKSKGNHPYTIYKKYKYLDLPFGKST